VSELKVVPKSDAFLLVEDSGTICGIYATEKDAMKAKPKVEANIKAFEENGTLVKIRRPRRKRKGRRKTRPSRKQA
jgi:hypothetical protein